MDKVRARAPHAFEMKSTLGLFIYGPKKDLADTSLIAVDCITP